MGRSLIKGGNAPLDYHLRKVAIELSWDADCACDLYACAFLLDYDAATVSDGDFVFCNQPSSSCGSVLYQRVAGARVERFVVDFSKVSCEIKRIVFVATLNAAEERELHFGMIRNAAIRAVDPATGAELALFELGPDAPAKPTLVFAELYDDYGEWKFRALGQGYNLSIDEVARRYGVENLAVDSFNVARDAEE